MLWVEVSGELFYVATVGAGVGFDGAGEGFYLHCGWGGVIEGGRPAKKKGEEGRLEYILIQRRMGRFDVRGLGLGDC